ncbi:carbohydrate ABC transporter permease [Paenibacillus lycopersici]|uniref:Carbohydrate ABC transporter permease n=1 Tax=Paenibacillus lycopersici TaxID=2704462 RepID=A0A6C0G8I5_9BACL|nr:carbohydrate ABC transporter permease [Paenibacillus lycopersici]QHT64067.1 carbohydrate ABC transporter permease [Paenibacillus lycopersici]
MMLLPFVWMITTSFKTYPESVQIPPVWIPKHPDFSWYSEIFKQVPFGRYYMNTVMIAVGRTVPQVIICSMAAYGFARLRFPGRNVIFICILAILMVPSQVLLIPQYYEIVRFHWVDTYKALIVPGIFSAYGTFLLRQFFMSLPKELEEAAVIDGCNPWTIFWRIMLPLTVPALSALTFFVVLWSWNDFMWPLVVTNDESMRVLSVGINSLQGLYVTRQPLLMAGAVMATIPLLIFFLVLQKFVIKGITFSGIKG